MVGVTHDADHILREAEGKTLGETLQNGIAGILLGIAASIISGILTVADLVIIPANALANALPNVVDAFIVEPLRIIEQGAQTSAISLMPGSTFAVGPFTLAFGIIAVLAAYWILSKYLQEDETSNVIPAAPFDISLPWFSEEEGNEEG